MTLASQPFWDSVNLRKSKLRNPESIVLRIECDAFRTPEEVGKFAASMFRRKVGNARGWRKKSG